MKISLLRGKKVFMLMPARARARDTPNDTALEILRENAEIVWRDVGESIRVSENDCA